MAKLTNTPRASLGLELERRKSFMLQVTVLNSDGTAMDLTGCTMRFVLKDTHYDDDNLDLNNLLVNNEAGEAFSYFPILFVFSNSQVDRTVKNFNSATVKSETVPLTEPDTVFGPVTGEDLPF